MEEEFNTVKELDACGSATAMGHAGTSSVLERELPKTFSRQVLPSHDCNWKLYSRVAARCAEKNYKLTLRSKDNHPHDMIKKILK